VYAAPGRLANDEDPRPCMGLEHRPRTEREVRLAGTAGAHGREQCVERWTRGDALRERLGAPHVLCTVSSSIPAANVRLKRAYEPPHADDGARILVDRLWPRGVTKAKAAVDRWMKDLAPSAELRQWFGHDPARWNEFRRRYAAEVRARPELLGELRTLARDGVVTLVYAARDEAHNDAVVLRDVLLGRATLRARRGGSMR
jgi:uncharacterized protein YeaO (DUF488 family)